MVKFCKALECKKYARSKSDFCVGHGGGSRCKHLDCEKNFTGEN